MSTIKVNFRIPIELNEFINDSKKFKTATSAIIQALQLLKSADDSNDVLSDAEIINKISDLVEVLKSRKKRTDFDL